MIIGELATYSPSSVCRSQRPFLKNESYMNNLLTDHDCPNVDAEEERDIRSLRKWKQKWENMVRNTLRKSVQRMKGMACKGSRHDPFVMGFVESLVETRMV